MIPQSKQRRTYYQSKKYNNPFFQKDKKRSSQYQPNIKKKRLLFVAVSLFFCVLIWFFVYSDFFSIKSTEIKEGGRLDTQEIEKTVWAQINSAFYAFLPQKNIFLFNAKRLEDSLGRQFILNDFSIKKKIPSKLIIRVAEKKYYLIWQEDDRYYYGAKQGSLIAELPNVLEINRNEYPIIQNQKSEKLSENLANIESVYVGYILDLFAKLKTYPELLPDFFIVDNEKSVVKLKLIDGPKIYFNINESAEKQINKVLVLKNEKLKESFLNKEYIDVRLGDSIYFR